MRKLLLIFTLTIGLMVLINCNPGNKGSLLTSLSPSARVSHLPAFILTVIGADFTSDSRIVFNGAEKQTTYIGPTELTCWIDRADIALGATTVPVTVRNTATGSESEPLDFTIHANHTFNSDNHKELTTTAFLTTGLAFSTYSSLAVDNQDNLYVSWFCSKDPTNRIYFSGSQDNGENWSTPAVVSHTGFDSTPTDIAVDDSGNINIIWLDDKDGGHEIHFSRSIDGGSSWSTAKPCLSIVPESLYNPKIAADSTGNIYVMAWGDSERNVYFTRSTDGGETWTGPTNITGIGNSLHPDIVADKAGNLYIIWDWRKSLTSYNLNFGRSVDGGDTWSTSVIKSDIGPPGGLSLAVDDSGNINVVWADGPAYSTDTEIYFSRSTDDGASWSVAVALSDTEASSSLPVIATDSVGNINVAWHHDYPIDSTKIFFARSHTNGATWKQVEVEMGQYSDRYSRPAIGVFADGYPCIVFTCMPVQLSYWSILYSHSQ